MRRKTRNIGVVIALGVVALSALIATMTFRSSATSVDRTVSKVADKLLEDGEPAPVPSQADAAAIDLPAEGRLVTVKQRDKGWLPGGQYQLHLDDITGRQVMISVTDAQGHVIFWPKSVRKNDVFLLPDDRRATVQVEVVRLENMLVGGDFGEFRVRHPVGQPPPTVE